MLLMSKGQVSIPQEVLLDTHHNPLRPRLRLTFCDGDPARLINRPIC